MSDGQRYFEKDNTIISDCYAYESGIIRYVENKFGEIEVYIGSRLYEYNDQCMYYFPDGSEVKKFDRICSGVVNMNHVISELGSDINSIYLIFRKEFYSLMDNCFAKTGLVDLNSIQEELVELLFRGLTSVTYDPKSLKIQEIEYQGTQTSVLNRKSFYTVLSYGYSSRVVGKAMKGEVNISGDVMTDTILGLLLNDQLDTGKK